MKFARIINLIFIKYNIHYRFLILIINNANNNDILYRDLFTYLSNFKFNNLFNVKNNEKTKFLQYLLYITHIIQLILKKKLKYVYINLINENF